MPYLAWRALVAPGTNPVARGDGMPVTVNDRLVSCVTVACVNSQGTGVT